MKHNIWFLKWQINAHISSRRMLVTYSARIRDTNEHEDVEEEADDVSVDGEGGEGPVLRVEAVLVLPYHHHLRVH